VGQVTQGLRMLDAIRISLPGSGGSFPGGQCRGDDGGILLDIRRTGEGIQYLEKAIEKAGPGAQQPGPDPRKFILGLRLLSSRGAKRSIPLLENFLKQAKQVKMTVQLLPLPSGTLLGMEKGHLARIPDLLLEGRGPQVH